MPDSRRARQGAASAALHAARSTWSAAPFVRTHPTSMARFLAAPFCALLGSTALVRAQAVAADGDTALRRAVVQRHAAHCGELHGDCAARAKVGPHRTGVDGLASTAIAIDYDGGCFDRWLHARVPGKLVGAMRWLRLDTNAPPVPTEPVIRLEPSRRHWILSMVGRNPTGPRTDRIRLRNGVRVLAELGSPRRDAAFPRLGGRESWMLSTGCAVAVSCAVSGVNRPSRAEPRSRSRCSIRRRYAAAFRTGCRRRC